ncbi:MAG: hypothetical protein ACKPEA_18555, partial [Planctomycetota bacterium]
GHGVLRPRPRERFGGVEGELIVAGVEQPLDRLAGSLRFRGRHGAVGLGGGCDGPHAHSAASAAAIGAKAGDG